MVICGDPCECGHSLPLKENEAVGGGTRSPGILLSLSISSSVMPSAKGSSFILAVRSRNGSTAMDFCGCEAMAADAEGLLFATLPRTRKTNRKAIVTARQSAATAAQVRAPPRRDTVVGVACSLSEVGEGLGFAIARPAIDESVHGPTVATIRYPSRGTVSM